MAWKPCKHCQGPYRADGTVVEDWWYRGQMGHSPDGICLDCLLPYKALLDEKVPGLGKIIELAAQGKKQRAIAAVVGCSVRTVQRRFALLRKKFRTKRIFLAGFGSTVSV